MVVCAIGSRPHSMAETAMPAGVWVWATQSTSCRAAWMALWMTKPARFTPYSVALNRILPSRSIFSRLEAVISSYSMP